MGASLAGALLAGSLAPAAAMPVPAPPLPDSGYAAEVTADVVVYGATPGGVVAAVAAARRGASVTLVEPTDHIGGMMSSGLSWTDRGDVGAIGGLAREVFDRIQVAEGSAYGRYAFQPRTARLVFEEMLAEAGVHVVLNEPLAEAADAVTMSEGRISRIRTVSGSTFAAAVFIDAGYEGDLMARAGVSYRVGREAVSEYGESLAGVRPASAVFTLDPGIDPGFPVSAPGPLGSSDARIQASNYRLCLTTEPSNRVAFTAPDGYDPARYAIVLAYIRHRQLIGQPPAMSMVMHVDRLVRNKYDLNERGHLSLGLTGLNYAHPDATYAERAAIDAEQRAYQQGFLYFLSNDPEVPPEIRTELSRFGLCADEFVENGNWPPLVYIREARRMEGRRVLTQHDTTTLISKPDTIGLASYPLDSHLVSRWIDDDGRLRTEGGLGHLRVPRWSISYASITPERDEALNLLVPVAASATHVAHASLRMEPQYMIIGHAAGTAAALAWERSRAVQDISVDQLQQRLRGEGAVIDDPGDIADAFYAEVEWAFYQGVTAGCGPGRFCPSLALPRDQMAALLARTLDLPKSSTDHFDDDEGSPFEAAINAVADAGITTGCDLDSFCAGRTVTRQEMASFLVRAFELPPSTTDHFTDDAGSIHHADINALASADVTSGCTPSDFCPAAVVTRGQTLAFLHRIHEGGPLEGTLAGPATGDEPPASPAPAATPTPSPTSTPAPEPTDAPTPTPAPTTSPDLTPDPTPTPTPDPTAGTPTPEPTPSPSPSASASASGSASAEPSDGAGDGGPP